MILEEFVVQSISDLYNINGNFINYNFGYNSLEITQNSFET